MGTRARGFLLFSFAFSSVLSSPEITAPSGYIQTKLNSSIGEKPNNSTNVNIAIKSACFHNGSCSRDGTSNGNIEKREINYSPNKKFGELYKGLEVFRNSREPDFASSFTANSYPTNDQVEKRARVGFTGMRGKKDSYVYDNYDEKAGTREEDINDVIEMLEKRSRMGFNGMRGKKYDFYDKRGQMMAFHGMRGKKSEDYEAYGFEEPNERLVQGNIEDLTYGNSLDDGLDKRTMGFHGMRGRREEPAIVKRTPFVFGVPDKGYEFKRTMGFLGMRGKKTPESSNWSDYRKRGFQSGFFGMKGKKAQSGFFGMRGKKSIPEFIGVLGEKEPLDNELNTIITLNESESPQERVRRGTSWLRNSKKAKSAFFAVRGKKSYHGNDMNFVPTSE